MRPSMPPRKAGDMRIKDRRTRMKRGGDKTPNVSFAMSLVMRIQLLFEMVLPESFRSVLANAFATSDERYEAYENIKSPKARTYFVRTVCRFLPLERNDSVRRALFEAVKIVSRVHRKRYYETEWDFLLLRSLYSLLTRKDYVSDEEREDALGLLCEIDDDGDIRWDDYSDVYEECCARVFDFCLEMFEKHCTSKKINDITMERMMCLMNGFGLFAEGTDRIIDNEYALPLLVDILAISPNRKLQLAVSGVFRNMFVHSEHSNRITFIIRHFTRFEQILLHMKPHDLVDLMAQSEFCHLISSSHALLCRVSEELHKMIPQEMRYEDEYICQLARLLLENAIADASKLQELLGYGYIVTARYFAHGTLYGLRFTSPHGLFQRILDMFPGWQEFFKELTKDGDSANQTAILGRGIRTRPTRPPVHYVFWDEDCVEF